MQKFTGDKICRGFHDEVDGLEYFFMQEIFVDGFWSNGSQTRRQAMFSLKDTEELTTPFYMTFDDRVVDEKAWLEYGVVSFI